MKTNSTCFLRPFLLSSATIASIIVIAATSYVYAQEQGEGTNVPNEDPAALAEAVVEEQLASLPEEQKTITKEVESDLIQNKTIVLDLVTRAIARYSEDLDFEDAFVYFEEAEKELSKNGSSAEQEVYKERIASEKKKAQILWGEKIYSEAQSDYTKLLQMEHSEDRITLGSKIDLSLTQANAVYYAGVRPGRPVDSDVIRKEISKDPLKGDFNDRIQKLRSKVQSIIDGEEYFQETNLDEVDPRYDARNKEISALYRAGEFLFQASRYTEARDKMEQILIRDPYNEMAITMLERIYRKLYAIADLRVYNELLRESAQTEWSWVENIPDDKNIIASDGPKVYSGSDNELFNRLNSIIIEHIEFIDSDIPSAITLLRNRTKDSDPEGRGINIILTPSETFRNKTVTLELDRIPVAEVVRYICKQTGLDYRINEADKTLTIGSGSDVSDMVTRFIPIRQAIIKRIVSDMQDAGDSVELQADLGTVDASFANVNFDNTFTTGVAGAEAMNHVESIKAEALKKYFIDNGIPFQKGASIAYNSRANKLTVVNTPENVRQLELAIRDMDVQNPLIMIESKMVEIKMNDLEELGFNWVVTHKNSDDSHYMIGLDTSTIGTAYSNNALVKNLNLIPNFGPGGSWNVFLTVNAIDRTDRAEILCTPKVVTTSGRQAQIQMVRQMYFPEEWNEPEISTSCGSSITFEPSYPEFGSPRDIGTDLTVTPTLYSNNYTIRLQLQPSVTDLTGWSDYSYDYVIGDFKSGENYPMTLKMAEISVRSVDTTIKVYDGQTVIIGGILSDGQGSISDKKPLFGDIPIIGRFFSESAHSAKKDNLIISVTTRLISGDGIPVRTNIQNGLPDFRR